MTPTTSFTYLRKMILRYYLVQSKQVEFLALQIAKVFKLTQNYFLTSFIFGLFSSAAFTTEIVCFSYYFKMFCVTFHSGLADHDKLTRSLLTQNNSSWPTSSHITSPFFDRDPLNPLLKMTSPLGNAIAVKARTTLEI